MQKLISTILIVSLSLCALKAQQQAQVFLPSGNLCTSSDYKLVFSEEFNGNSLDLSKWVTYFPYGPNGSDSCSFCRTHGSNTQPEGQVYVDSNVIIENGLCRLRVLRDSATWYDQKKAFTSGMIQSKQGFNTYTKYEIKCKLPPGCGFWSAFWVFGGGVGPATEIDIIEHGCLYPDIYDGSVHCYNDNDLSWKGVVTHNLDLSQAFHTYGVIYEPLWVKFYFDGELKLTMPKYYLSNGQSLNTCQIVSGNYFLEPEFPVLGNTVNIIANVAVGANKPDGGTTPYTPPPTSTATFPQTMDIEYIRAWQTSPQQGLYDLCSQVATTIPSVICSGDTAKICFDGLSSTTIPKFTMSSNISVLQNPAYDLETKRVTIIKNGVPVDTFIVDTVFSKNCIRVKPNISEGFGSITIAVDNSLCPNNPPTQVYPITIGIPTPSITVLPFDPCKDNITIETLNYDHNTIITWEIYDQGTMQGTRIISNSGTRVNIDLDNEKRKFTNEYFYIKLTVKNKCGEKTAVVKVTIPNQDCYRIEYRLSPNPATDIMNIQLDDSEMLSYIKEIKVVDNITNGIAWSKNTAIVANDLNLNVSNFNNGLYQVLIINHQNDIFAKQFNVVR